MLMKALILFMLANEASVEACWHAGRDEIACRATDGRVFVCERAPERPRCYVRQS